jgi:hypothetical protein
MTVRFSTRCPNADYLGFEASPQGHHRTRSIREPPLNRGTLADAASFDVAEVHMLRLTVFLARFIGLSTVLIVVGFLVRGSAMIEATAADGPVMLAYAIISLATGVAMIVGHNVWSGGALPIVVTLAGWLIFAKGLVLLFLTPEALNGFFERMQYGQHLYLYLGPALAIGLYLTWAGFTAPTQRR